MKKPDRFERMLDKHTWHSQTAQELAVSMKDAVDALRKEHRWVKRMVRAEKVSGETGAEGDIAYNTACDHILERLKQRRK